jgi:hypothetical protein
MGRKRLTSYLQPDGRAATAAEASHPLSPFNALLLPHTLAGGRRGDRWDSQGCNLWGSDKWDRMSSMLRREQPALQGIHKYSQQAGTVQP